MKCPNPHCDNAALEDSHAFCFKCGSDLKKRATSNDGGGDGISGDENPTPNQDLNTDAGETADEGQRKRKGEQHEEKPAKRKSFDIGKAHGNSPLDAELADDAASAMQNLALKSKLQDQQERPSSVAQRILSTDQQNSSTGIHLADTCVSGRLPGDQKQDNQEQRDIAIYKTEVTLYISTGHPTHKANITSPQDTHFLETSQGDENLGGQEHQRVVPNTCSVINPLDAGFLHQFPSDKNVEREALVRSENLQNKVTLGCSDPIPVEHSGRSILNVPGTHLSGDHSVDNRSQCFADQNVDQDKDQSTFTKGTLPGKTTDDRRHSNETITPGNQSLKEPQPCSLSSSLQGPSTDTVHADKATISDEKLSHETESENFHETNQACEIMETEDNLDPSCSNSQMQTIEDHLNLDEGTEEKDESDEEHEEDDAPVDENEENKTTDQKGNESKSQKDRRKKKERKKRKEAAGKATAKEGKSSAVQIQDQGHDTGDAGEGCSKKTAKDGKAGSKKPAQGINKAGQEQKMAKERNSQGYFANDNRESMTVVFHAVLAPHFKFEKRKGDKVVMRFGKPAFGKFQEDVTEMQLEMPLKDEFLLFNGMLQVPVDLVKERLFYKYVVVRKARERKENDMFLWEHVDNAPYKNRCLAIPKSRCQAGTIWHQYDDAIFGEKSLLQSLRNMMPFWRNIDATEGRTIATLAMLPRWEGFSVGRGRGDMTAWEAVEEVKDVAYCMTQSKVQDYQGVIQRVPRGYIFDRVLKDYLAPKIKENASRQSATEKGDKKIMHLVSSVTIAHVLYKHKVSLEEDDFRNLFQSLVLWSEPKEKTCTAFEELIKHFPGEHLRTLGESIQALCRQVVRQCRELHDWLFAVPLVHFLTQQSEPFSNSSLLMEMPKGKDETWWGSERFETRVVRDRSFGEQGSPCSVMNMLHPLFDLDPLFRRTFLLVVPCREYGKVAKSGKFPPVEVCTTLARILSEKERVYMEERQAVATVLEKARKTFQATSLGGITSSTDGQVDFTQEMLLSCATACVKILKVVADSCDLDLLSSCLLSIQMWTAALDHETGGGKGGKRKTDSLVRHAVEDALTVVKKWLKSNLHPQIPCYNKTLIDEELQIWSRLFAMCWRSEECQGIWRTYLLDLLKRRLEERACNDLVQLLTKTDLSEFHGSIQDLVCESTYKKVESMLERGAEGEVVFTNLSGHGLDSPQASKCGELLTLMLTRCWPVGPGGVQPSGLAVLRHVLTWRLWPCFFRRFGPASDYRRVLKPDGQDLLMRAISSLEAASGCLKQGTIELQVLELLRKHSANFLALIDHIVDEDGQSSFLKHVLGRRCDELRLFLEERQQVSTFIRMCSLIKSVDLAGLPRKVTLDASRRSINELAQPEIIDGKCVTRVTFFGLTQTQKEMISGLDSISDSVLLRRLWEKSGTKALNEVANCQPPQKSLSIKDVEELVWKPSITKLTSLQDQFVTGSISFKDVDRYFDIFKGNKRYDDLAREMKLITSKNPSGQKCSDRTIDIRIAQVQQYHMLRHCIDTARIIWDFKTALQLQGDFQLVDDLRNQLNDVFKERPLRSMNPALQRAGMMLSNITTKRAQCLSAVARCQDFIEWLRNAVGGPQEIKVLVDLISAGETDMETARITCLHTSCLGFAPLIFDLKPTFGFDELMRVCEPVWDAVDSDPSLPEKLVDTSGQLEWLKGVKDSHGSVALSSLMEAETINQLGVYHLGCLDTQESHSALSGKTLDCVVHLSVPVRGQAENKNYRLNDLKDLQSKLMLIAAKASQGKGEVDRFVEIFQGVLRVAKVYVALCEAGEVSHLNWSKEFHCRPKLVTRSLTEDLNDQGDKMEQCLRDWKKEMHIKRLRYNKLNYFTTQQLLFLRNKLASVRGRGPNSVDGIPLEVYNLLESVFPGLEPSSLKAALIASGICCRPVGTDFTRTFGASGVCDAESVSRRSRSRGVTHPSGLLSVEEQKFQSLVANLDLIGLSEEVALAALMSCGDVSEANLLLWCVQNGKNEALVSAKYAEALNDPRYAPLVVRDTCSKTEKEIRGSDEVAMTELEDSAEPMEYTFTLDQTAGGKYLGLDELGCLLMYLNSQGPKKERRLFPRYLKRGKPNLVVVPKGDVLGTVLSLYMHGKSQTLPTSEEVLICQTDTTAEEVELFWRRSLGDKEGRLFCLVNADILDYGVAQKAADALEFLLQEPQYNRNEGLSLMVICSSENEDRAHMVAALDQYRLTTAPRCALPKEIRDYFKEQFKSCGHEQGRFRDHTFPRTAAAELDKEKLSVRVVLSETAGAGKSLVVRRLSERLHDLHNNDVVTRYLREMGTDLPLCISVPVYGPAVNQSAIVDTLLPHLIAPDLPLSRIFHIDVHPSATDGLDTFLFNLLVLGVLTSRSGQVWRRRSCDLFVIEITSHSKDQATGTVRRELAPRFPGNQSALKKASSEPFHKLLPTIHCGTPRQTLFQLKNQQNVDTSLNPLFDDAEFRCTYVQRAFQYLKLWGAGQSLDDFWFVPGQVMGDHAECLETLMRHCGIQDPSWAEVRHFVNFLNSQLRACEESSFCDTHLVGDTLEGFRTFVVRFMIHMSRDFATPSLSTENDRTRTLSNRVDDDDDAGEGDNGLEITELRIRRRWETSSHPYIFFNHDRITMTFVGFHIDQNGNLIDPDRRVIIEPNLMSRHLRTGLFVQRVDMETNYESWSKGEKIEKLCAVMGVEWPYDPDDSYELTTDNLKKILAIHMRFRCGIPVVIMGETGCGKTRLIRYMCGLQSGPGGPKNMLLMKVHGGTSWDDIRKKVEQAEDVARENEPRGIDTVLFFDEANTTDALGMIKEVMVDRRVNGRRIGVGLQKLQFIAACNPYRKHTEEMIVKLESAGLGYLVKTQDTRHRIGRIPLRHLVYRVHALPESMRPLVWDFGQLKPEIEELYTRQIVSRFILQERKLPGDQLLVKAVTAVLTASQRYMRDQTDECSFVSLRDVERAMNVMVWFYNHLRILKRLMDETDENENESDEDDDDEEDLVDAEDEEGFELDRPLDDVTLALVLSLGVCYQARLQDREPYRVAVAQSFVDPCKLFGGHRRILHEITRCQRAVLNELELGPNIARNTALSENVFMMVVCIELRIPLFVVGKPGSSKSLAKTVVAHNMEGDASRSRLFKTFKQVQMVSYQCSPLSTADGIMTTFHQCSKLQQDMNPEKFVSVVVLDEVGLAEDSPLMPLKTLHPLLEDGVTSTDDIIEVEKRTSERVAFIGISNWALDPAKMNRGIMLSRDLPDKRELVDSAMGICSTDARIQSLVAPLINSLAQGYSDLYKQQQQSKALQESKKDEFFGLRDFYSLVKMVYRMAEEAGREPRWFEVEHAIRRNFGGLDELDPVKFFKKHFSSLGSRLVGGGPTEENFRAVDLIKASLERRNTRGESRYLLVLTENYAALPVVQRELLREKDDPVVIFGSSFPKDQEYTQICRNINRIKVCMETGRTVILLNLESLYESLYDALNQYYMMFGGQKYVDLGLGSHRVKCRVHDDFRLIVIADRDVVYSKFPIPLINRLEKHYLVTSASLDPHQQRVVKALEEWVAKFSHVQAPRHQHRRTYSAGDAFVGYHSNTAASVVLQVCNNLEQNQQRMELSSEEAWDEEVFRESQELLLRCATPDAVARLPCTRLDHQADDLWAKYFTVQEHSSLTAFLRNVLTTEEKREHEGLLIQVTTHSRLLSSNDLVEIAKATLLPLSNIACLSLQQFHTEQQFCFSVRDFFGKLGGTEGLLLVQCDSGDVNSNLIACARHLLVDQRSIAEEDFTESFGMDSLSFVHIVLIVQLPRRVGGCTTFAGFQGGTWLSVHIDELHPPSGQIPAVEFMVDRSVSELFDASPHTVPNDAMDFEEEGADSEMETSSSPQVNYVADKVDVVNVLRSCVQAAVSRIDDESSGSLRSARRIELMLKLLPESAAGQPDFAFATVLARRIHELLKEKDERAGDTASDWLRSEALSGTGIQENGTFRKALWQRVYASVAPILSEVIAFIDRDSNLELVGEDGSWVARVWLALFQRPSIAELHYDSFLSLESAIIRERVPLINSGRDRRAFESQFPFSWLIKKRIDAMWRDACSVSANSRTPVLQCLQDAISHSDIGAVMEDIRSENYEQAAVLRYLHDFVHMVHKPTVPQEDELVSRAIATAARELHMESNSEEEFSLSVSLVHVVYNRIEKRLGQFCQLVQAQPDIVRRLLQVIPAVDTEMVLDAVALQLCLAQLEPSEQEFDDPETRQIWCSRVLSIRPSADSMIRDHAQVGRGPKTTRILRACRSVWQRVSAVRLFIEHTCPGTSVYHPADIKNVFKLWKALGDETDFTTPQTMQVIEKFLVDCSEAVSKRYTSYGVSSCPVCFEGLPGKDPVKVPCGHVFCLVCISQWIGRGRQCPVCKQPIPEDFKLVSTKPIRKAVEEHANFRSRCNSFFMELVSMFCFGSMSGGHAMDSELFAMFMSYVINARSQTKNFSPFPEHGVDATPVVRSFLLQQLLRAGDEEVRGHMAHYLSEVRGLTPEIDDMLQVCQLFVHCKEDALISQYSDASGSLLLMVILARTLCEEAMPNLTSSSLKPSRELDVTVLESVAKARYALTLASKFMLSSIEDQEGLWGDIQLKNELSSLVEAVRRMCYKSLSPVPRLYLLKMLVRKFGVDSIHTVCNRKEFEWIIPPESRNKQQEDLVPDKFVIYGDAYREIREAMAQAVLSGTRKELTKVLENAVLAPLSRDVIVLLSEYREVTTCYSFTSEQRRLAAKAHQCIGEFLQNNQYLSAKARPFALQLLDNNQGAAYPALRVAPGRSTLEQSLGEIVVHTSAVLQCINQGTICEPLRRLMENPAAMRNCFLPSMPDDNLEEAMAGIKETGTWYQCPKGHPYYIGDCGRPVEVKVCPECKVNIGGRGYTLSQGNTAAQRGDRTLKGHVLGHPRARPKVLAPERTLSSVVVAVVRVLVHSAMLAGASHQPHDVSSLVHPNVPIEALGRFLWDHLQFDVEALARGLGRSVDDAVLCVHMVLTQLTTHASQQPQGRNIASNLSSKVARRDWETAFTAAIVAPVLANLEDRIQHSLKSLVDDKRLGNNPLMRQLYEVDLVSEDLTETVPPTCPALWRYRTQVTIEHVSHTFQQEVASSDPERNKVLGEFLRQEHTLRAVRFLPDIVRLQRLLMDKFHRRIDRKEAEEMSLQKFFTNISSKAEREELKSLTASFKSAWNMVRLNLDQQGRLRPPTDLCETSITNQSPVAALLPSTSGMGICSTALVYYLTSLHNEFNQRYQNLTGGKVKDLAHVQMKDVTTSHLIAYHPERDLMPLILAQCNYSLEVGQGTVVQYNWDALERQLIDRFIRGRPLIDFEDERFAFSRDVQLDSVFASVRTKIPQVPLHAATSRQIVDEFRSLSDICDVLSLLDIAIGFLSSAGGSPELHLGQYLRRVLRMPQENSLRSSKAQHCCQLRHLMSLWRLLTLERARILMKRGEDPFDQISDTYKQAMSPKLMMSFSNVMRRIDLDRFVCEVLELIVLNLKGDVTPGEEDMSLGDYVQWHLDNKGSEPVTGLEELPSTVLLKHVISAWRVSVELCDSYHDKRDSAAA